MKILRYEQYSDGSFVKELIRWSSSCYLKNGKLFHKIGGFCGGTEIELNINKKKVMDGTCGVYFEALRPLQQPNNRLHLTPKSGGKNRTETSSFVAPLFGASEA
jgi:hypothetical protein